MLTHKDPEVQAMLELLEGQRDYAMGVAAAQAKQVKELKAQLEAVAKQTENQNGDAN
jgi:hypothetical protein